VTNISPAVGETGSATAGQVERHGSSSPLSALHRPVLLGFIVLVAVTAVMHFANYVDYVGADNDDVMRLVEVRDLLAGQGWFDLMQYRLGLEGGTLMHWSRLIDLPIANLIMLFSLFLSPGMAEAAALFVWPLLTAIPVFYAMAAGGTVLAGRQGGLLALVLAFLFVLGVNRFQPGSIDHHNVQLGLIATIAACLILPGRPPYAHAVAGVAAALAIAIGAETTPHIVVACAIVAVQWLWLGDGMKAAASAFALAMATTLTAVFFLTVPPAQYGMVACDALSTGFYALGVIGAGSFFLAVSTVSARSLAQRLAALGLVGAATLAAAVVIAPQCLGNPLATLDPLLKSACGSTMSPRPSPCMAQLNQDPWTAGGFYLVPVLAMALCLRRIRERRDVPGLTACCLHCWLVSWGIALVQVRGAVFANLLVGNPDGGADRGSARPRQRRSEESAQGARLCGHRRLRRCPSSGLLPDWVCLDGGRQGDRAGDQSKPAHEKEKVCTDADAMAVSRPQEPAGVVSGPSNLGAHILRFTPHRVLSAPYHRNQGGMLTELHAAMAKPERCGEVPAWSRGHVVAYCRSDPQTGIVIVRRARRALRGAEPRVSCPTGWSRCPAPSRAIAALPVLH
jgi:hypothetical protein